jgi:competence protein ComEA
MIRKLLAALLAFVASAAFAAIDINKATQADLESIKGIGPVISTKILDERKKGGPFKDWNDVLGRVKGIGEGNASKFSADGLTVNDKAFRTTAAGNAGEARASAKTGADAKADRKTDAKSDAKAEAKAGAKADPKADVKPMTQGDAKTSAPAAAKAPASAPAAKK